MCLKTPIGKCKEMWSGSSYTIMVPFGKASRCPSVLLSFPQICLFTCSLVYLTDFVWLSSRVIAHSGLQLHTEQRTSSVYSRSPSHSDLLMLTSKQLQPHWNPPTHPQEVLSVCVMSSGERETLTQSLDNSVRVCIVSGAGVYAATPTTGLCCCFSAALQRPAPPLAHNFRPVSPATRVSAHGEQPTSPDESFCQYSHDH